MLAKSTQSFQMNLKLFFIASGVILFSNSLIFFKNQFADTPYQLLLLFSLFMALALWYVFLKKEIPIEFKALRASEFKIALPIFAISVAALAVYFSTDERVNTNSLLLMFATALLVGVYEEILFRAIIFKSLLKSDMKPTIAIYLSSIIFSFFHMSYIWTMGIESLFLLINTFMMGLFFAFVYLRTRNMLFLIAMHTLWDFATFINQSLPLGKPSSVLTIALLSTTFLYFTWSLKNMKTLKE